MRHPESNPGGHPSRSMDLPLHVSQSSTIIVTPDLLPVTQSWHDLYAYSQNQVFRFHAWYGGKRRKHFDLIFYTQVPVFFCAAWFANISHWSVLYSSWEWIPESCKLMCQGIRLAFDRRCISSFSTPSRTEGRTGFGKPWCRLWMDKIITEPWILRTQQIKKHIKPPRPDESIWRLLSWHVLHPRRRKDLATGPPSRRTKRPRNRSICPGEGHPSASPSPSSFSCRSRFPLLPSPAGTSSRVRLGVTICPDGSCWTDRREA
jgi:hypothetical protein